MRFTRLLSRSRLERSCLAAAALGTIAIATGCGGTVGVSAPGSSGALTVFGTPTGPNVPGFNPFSNTDNVYQQGVTSFVYEPLLMYNLVNPSKIYPWLASSYAWSAGGKKLTFTIPAGRKWSDGTRMTAADVAFTFKLIKKFPALNINGVVLRGASAPSPTKAVLTFAAPAYAQLYEISQVYIVPQHIWAKIPNPSTYGDATPIGTGPYLLKSITPEAMTFAKNTHYWQAGLPKVATVRVPQFSTNTTALEALSSGQFDWSTVYMTNPKKQWLDFDPTHNKLWLPTVGQYFLCPNTAVAPLNSAAVRRALAVSFDRQRDVTEVEHGYYTPDTNPTGLPTGSPMLAQYAHQTLTYNPGLARKEFIAAGLKGGATGTLRLANGQPFKVSLVLPSSYSDFMAMGQLMVNQMKAAGIDASLDGVSLNAQTSDASNGQFQLTFCGDYVSNGPYTTYSQMLGGSQTAAIGKSASTNIVRWNDAATNAALAAYRSTGDPAKQAAAIKRIGTIVAQQDPIIPLMKVGSFGQYTTKRFTGFPGPGNPYQSDIMTGQTPEDVLIHLRPAG